MNVKIIPTDKFRLEVDGKLIHGEFHVESEWEGMIKLSSDGPINHFIVKKPNLKHLNVYDYVPLIFGGGQNPKALQSVIAEVVEQTAIRVE